MEEKENKIITGLKQAIEFAKGDETNVKITTYKGDNQEEMENLLLLKKSSLDVKNERKMETVPFSEIEGILLGLQNLSCGADAYKQIGLSTRTFNDNKSKGHVAKTTKYALLGLLSEQQKQNQFNPTQDELDILYTALVILEQNIIVSSISVKKTIKNLNTIITNLMEINSCPET